MSTFAERLVESRKTKGVTPSQLCSEIGMSGQTLYNWETGVSTPSTAKSREKAKAIAEYLGVTETWLMSGAGVRTIEEKEQAIMQAKERTTPPTTVVYRAKDKRALEDIELLIHHLKELNLSTDEKKAIFLTLSEIRSDLELKVLFGASV